MGGILFIRIFKALFAVLCESISLKKWYLGQIVNTFIVGKIPNLRDYKNRRGCNMLQQIGISGTEVKAGSSM